MNRIPFTASQWQELEHQALIFKYIASGIPVPSDLLFSLHRTACPGTSLSSKFLSPQSQHAWSCFHMGMVGKKIDPEPGRCRRTDGKKWRCAKEAYPDSKYCERHMHRGKNRSRKHVEVLNNTPSPNPSLKTTTLYSLNPAPTSTPQSDNSNPSCYNNFLDTQDFRRNRYTYGVKAGVDEHAFFCEPSGTMRSFSASSMENSWHLANNSSSSSRQREYSYLQLQSHGDGERQSHLFHGVPLVKNERGDEPNKTTHRFFDEEPIRSRDWDSSSTTRLSISIPSSSSNDYFPLNFNSRRKLDG